jgi:hypothetical protein
MIEPDPTTDEERRLETLRAYDILDTLPEGEGTTVEFNLPRFPEVCSPQPLPQ